MSCVYGVLIAVKTWHLHIAFRMSSVKRSNTISAGSSCVIIKTQSRRRRLFWSGFCRHRDIFTLKPSPTNLCRRYAPPLPTASGIGAAVPRLSASTTSKRQSLKPLVTAVRSTPILPPWHVSSTVRFLPAGHELRRIRQPLKRSLNM